jgi:hypothetical protein
VIVLPRVRLEPVRVWLYHHIPPGLLWHPAEWFLSFLCALTGTISLTTGVRSGTLDQLLPAAPYRIWSAFLIIGAVALGRGLSSISWHESHQYVVTKVAPYRLGLRLLGLAVALYIAALYAYAGLDGFVASIVPLAFVGMCLLRLVALGGPDERR